MTIIKNLFDQAQLAEAAYANFLNANTNAVITDPALVIAALQDASKKSIGSDSIDSVIKPKIFLERK